MKATQLLREIDRRAEVLGLSDIALAKKAGLGRDAVRDIRRGKTVSPSYDVVSKLAKALGCSVADLTGERTARRTAAAADPNVVTISELDVHVAAGQASADDVGQLMAAHEQAAVVGVHTYPVNSFREAYGIDPGKIRILAVRGDSMEPRLWAGQRVMVDIDDKTPSPPGIFVVWDGLGLVIKRVEVVPGSDPLTVRITSANPAYQPYERTLEEAHINGRVVGTWSRT
jgi:phage repressor protein C with HTH and peptisase S24 domain